MNTKTYFLHAAGKKIPVGATQPRYDTKAKGWVTDKGVFSTTNPGEYTVSAELVKTSAA